MNDHAKGREPQPQPEESLLSNQDPWLVYVDVYLKSVADPDNPEFTVESCLPHEERAVSGKTEKYLQFANNCRPGFKIIFHLHDRTTPGGHTFPRRADDAVWSRIGKGCPDEEWGRNEVFNPLRVIEPDRTALVVRFENDRPIGDFRYTLNVVNREGRVLHLDPGGTGTNGPSVLR